MISTPSPGHFPCPCPATKEETPRMSMRGNIPTFPTQQEVPIMTKPLKME